MSKKYIKIASKLEEIDLLSPAKKFVPEWYKNIKTYNEKNIEFEKDNSNKKNIKNCVPFFDSLVNGYIATLYTDIHVSDTPDGYKYIRWSKHEEPIEVRNPSQNPMPIPSGCAPDQFSWRFPYYFKSEKGYSLLFTHPLNRFDLPFITLSGIVDSEFAAQPGNLPFFIKKDFTGIIKQGTPIVQIIPIKNESWKITNDKNIIREGDSNNIKRNRKFYNYYRDNFWIKKDFE